MFNDLMTQDTSFDAKNLENADAYKPAFCDAHEKSVAKITESNWITGLFPVVSILRLLEVSDHGCTPVWKLIVAIAKLYCDRALALPMAASVC